MPAAARDLNVTPSRSTERELTVQSSSVAIGAAGAVDPTVAGYRVSPGVTMSRTGAGTYSLVYPVCPNATIQPYVEMSPALTVVDAVLTAKSPSAGTATIKTLNAAGAATDPASGDLIGLRLELLPTGVI